MSVAFERGYDEIRALLATVTLPRIATVEQRVAAPPAIPDVEAAVREALRAVTLPRGRIAVGVGSRGVARIGEIVRALVAALREAGAEPFIFPAMGSHGASTAEGQARVLEHLGVTTTFTGAPIRATMDVRAIGRTPEGVEVYLDANAHDADAIVVVNRVKPHTAFRGPIESGPTKMLAIGCGKQRGAHAIHAAGWGCIHETIPAAARVVIGTGKVAFALAILENAQEAPCAIEAIPADRLLDREPALQVQAKALLGTLPFGEIDVLVVDRIGKNISGDGADPNVTGRYPTPYGGGGPAVTRLVFLGLTDETEGNANGLGLADVVTADLAEHFIPPQTYVNALTSTTPEVVRMPMVMPDADLAVRAALMMCPGIDPAAARIVRIVDTLHVRRFVASEAAIAALAGRPGISVSPLRTFDLAPI